MKKVGIGYEHYLNKSNNVINFQVESLLSNKNNETDQNTFLFFGQQWETSGLPCLDLTMN